MDQNRMVTAGRDLVTALDDEGLSVDAAIWVYDADRQAWKLWIALTEDVDVEDFYLGIAQVIAADRRSFPDLDVADTQPIPRDHPIIDGMRDYASIAGEASVRLTNNMMNGFYLSDGISVSLGRSMSPSLGPS